MPRKKHHRFNHICRVIGRESTRCYCRVIAAKPPAEEQSVDIEYNQVQKYLSERAVLPYALSYPARGQRSRSNRTESPPSSDERQLVVPALADSLSRKEMK